MQVAVDRLAGELTGELPSLPGRRAVPLRMSADAMAELSWVDTGSGRLRVTTTGQWISFNPLGPREPGTALRELVAQARR